jgi:hypothetical protein
MMVAWHEMPGNVGIENPSRRVRYDRLARGVALFRSADKTWRRGSIRLGGDGSCLAAFQAFDAWLPSFGPSGTILAPK